jgi:hypothetical protein
LQTHGGRSARLWRAARSSGIFDFVGLLIALYVLDGWPTPGINEAHYLTKSKQYWQPDWLPHDVFLGSGDAHVGFTWLIGWLTLFLPLSAVAWIGRVLGWCLMAGGWVRLCRVLFGGDRKSNARLAGVPLITGAGFFALTLQAHMAGEWIIGGAEGKVLAFGFVFLALAEAAANRWNRAWILIGAASAMHVLVGGWSGVALGVGWLCGQWDRRTTPVANRPPSVWRMLPGLVVGGAISLVGLIPGLRLTQGVSPDVAAHAAQIYVYFRLPHHVSLSAFEAVYIVRFVAMSVGLLVLYTLTPVSNARVRVRGFVVGSLVIAVAGAVIEAAYRGRPELSAPLLRFYWYRLSDIAVPLGVAVEAAAALLYAARRFRGVTVRGLSAPGVISRRNAGTALLAIAIIGGSGALVGVSVFQRYQAWYADPYFAARRIRHDRWVRACLWIAEHTPDDAVVLTPRRQQTFKWYAGRAEVFNYKDIPQDAAGLVEWKRRFNDIFIRNESDRTLALRVMQRRLKQQQAAEKRAAAQPDTASNDEQQTPVIPPVPLDEDGNIIISPQRHSLAEIDEPTMRRLAKKYGFRYVVFDARFIRNQPPRSYPALRKIYPVLPEMNEYYAVYELRDAATDAASTAAAGVPRREQN